jgi:signal transduction histidine kinase
LGSLIGGLFLLSAGWAIRQQEKFFLGKIALLAASFSRVERSFSRDGVSREGNDDEFLLMSQGLDQAGELLEQKTDEIERYKREFEKKTQLEQLAKTISYTSHNLKAPFLEGVDFFKNFPSYLDTMPREKLIRMGESLEKRFRQAGDSLQKALSQTRESYTRPEKVAVNELIRKFHSEVKRHPHYATTQVLIETQDCSDQAHIFCSVPEMDAALWNLMRNALDAKVDSQIQIRAFTDGTDAVVQFQDDGPGVPEFQREQIFEDFYTTKPFGSGLGLGSVKSTVTKYGGSIEAKPIRPGALFEIRLPLSTQSPPEAAHA